MLLIPLRFNHHVIISRLRVVFGANSSNFTSAIYASLSSVVLCESLVSDALVHLVWIRSARYRREVLARFVFPDRDWLFKARAER